MRKMNSQRGQVSTIAIVLLAVGLVVGAIGGYYFASSVLQPKIDDYEAQVADLNSEVSSLSATVSSLEDEITEYELQVFHLIQEIMVLETLTSDMQSELDELEQIIRDHEATALASSHILSVYESQIADLETEIERLQALLEPEEVNTFTGYGFSFEYPEGWIVSLYGLFESEPTELSGAVVANSQDAESVVAVSWFSIISVPDLEGTIDDAIDGMISESPGIELGERVTIVVGEYGAEHYQKYQSGTLSGYELLFSAWYCDVSDNVFLVMLVEPEPADMFATLSTLMESFECH